uniref:Leukotriene A-4 hydrolase-like n=1 Tax=Saccoglossus kowalevskii TaxID=10224 RepID=A0ABM0M3J9_SACKO|nr:PREDICTED: leukotriene A-4 hydrolase-like [Saccoglossus kowalevskii]
MEIILGDSMRSFLDLEGSADNANLPDSVVSDVLDTRDIAVKGVIDSNGKDLQFTVGDAVKAFGSALDIQFTEPLNKDATISVCVQYETSPKASALQWLTSEQTAGKKHPYLFSQCQAIHCRSMVPCQDAPSVKAPYKAKVTVPRELVALMSALRVGEEPVSGDKSKWTYKFHQKVPIPSYLIAIVVGALESRVIGPRSRVWSEKAMVDQAAYEFADTEQFLTTAEELCGPYVWGEYDLLILPPSFPYGGMENPCLTFVTPTIVAGDRSLVNVSCGWRKIHDDITAFGADNPHTNLVPNLEGIDPDDAFSAVPYEKGAALLFYLESLVGGPGVFEPFLRSYIDNFKYKCLTTAEWKDYLFSFFKDKQGIFDVVDWTAWFHSPGMPPVKPEYDTTMSNACTTLCKNWCQSKTNELEKFCSDDLKEFSPGQKIEFLAQTLLEEPLSVDHLKKMENHYNFNDSKNSEIRFRWYRLCIRGGWDAVIPSALDFVTEQGRMKFVRPIYKDLYAFEKSREQAIERFKKNRKQMNIICANMVAKDLKVTE